MKKLLGILVLGLLWCNVVVADIVEKTFNLSCQGEINTSGGWTGLKETNYFYEDFKITTSDILPSSPILVVKSLATNQSMMRNTAYDEWLSQTMKIEKNVINVTSSI